jgi:predicted ATPase
MLHRIAERTPVLLVVEDLHWADQSTRDLLGFLVRNLRAGLALVLTCRSDELRPGHPLRPFLAELNRGGRAERLDLGRLGGRDLAELVAGILGEPAAPGLSREILARSEGNPFFAEELLAARLEGTRLPPALRDLLLARVDALTEAAQRTLAAAAVAGSRVDHELLASVTGQDDTQLVPLLRRGARPSPAGGRRGQRRLRLPPRPGAGGGLRRAAAGATRAPARRVRPGAGPTNPAPRR